MNGISAVFVCPNQKLQELLVDVIDAVSGIKPAGRRDTESAKRALYAPAESRVIVNTASAAMHQQFGKHSVALVVEVDNPALAGMIAQDVFTEANFDSTVHLQAEPEFPQGFMAFVSVLALEGIVLLFWPKHPDPEIVRFRQRSRGRVIYRKILRALVE